MNNIYKKLSVILMFLSMIGCFKFNLEQVNGDSFFGTLSPGGIESCSNCGGGESYSRRPLAHGYRISLVYAKTENGHTAGERVSDTHSVDYWSKNENTGTNYVGYQALTGGKGWNSVSSSWNRKYLQYNNEGKIYSKLTKQEVALRNYSVITVNSNYDSYDFFKNNKKNSDMGVFDETLNSSECKSYVHMWRPLTGGTSLNYCQSHSGNFFANNAAQAFSERFFDKDPNSDSYEWNLLNNYITNCGYNKKNDAKENVISATSEGIVVQLEPVSAIAIYDNSWTVYIGSMAEIFSMWKGKYYNSSYSNYYSNYTDLNPIVYAKASTKYTILAKITLSNGDGLITYENNYNNSALGVVLFNLADYIETGCTDKGVQAIYSKYSDTSGKIIKGKENQYDTEISNLCTSGSDDGCEHLKSDNLSDYGIKSISKVTCNKPSCDTTVKLLFDKPVIDILKILIKNYQDRFTGFDKNNGIKKESDNQYITNFESKKTFSVTSDNDLCNSISCNGILSKISKTEDNLNKLKKRFGDYDLLDPEILKALYQKSENDNSWINKASCKGTPTCPVTPVTASCNGSNNFVLSDTADDTTTTSKKDDEKCLKNGIAYNSLEVNNKIETQKNNTQTSYDSEYGSPSNPGYCWESVTFNFPTSVTNITASNTFRWSTNGNTADNNDNLFGTMTVTRKCYLSKAITESNTSTITSKWAEVSGKFTHTKDGNLNYKATDWRINPQITIKYEEALPEDVSKEHTILKPSANLDVNLKNFEMHTYDNTGEELEDYNIVSYDNDGNIIDSNDLRYKDQDPRQFTCGQGIACSRLKYVEMTATYNLTYGDAFKWYSNRSKKDATNSMSEIPNNVKEQYEEKDGMLGPYRFIGYGLPTSFITPTNLAGTYDYGYDLSSKSGNGKLFAEVSQIGTKNRNGNGYHFDKMVKFAITDDDTNTNDGKIYYSCGFDINNHIFGYEDEPCEEGTCDTPKGLDVVFRTIDLMNDKSDDELHRAFPGMSGNGRDMGANWSEIYDIEDPNKGAENIFSILDSSIYSKEPMYNITLDVALIKEIRTLNDKVKGDPYSDKTEVEVDKDLPGYAGYYFGDLNEYGGGIRSMFLSYLYNNKKLDTSCIKSTKDNGGNERNHDCFKSIVVD